MEKVNKLIAAGASFAAAVKDSLGGTVEDFCAKSGIARPPFSSMLHGRQVPQPKQLNALTTELGGTPEQWLELWFKAAKRQIATRV